MMIELYRFWMDASSITSKRIRGLKSFKLSIWSDIFTLEIHRDDHFTSYSISDLKYLRTL